METLLSRVGLRGVDDTAPVWVDDVSGISSEMVSAINRNDEEVADLWGRTKATMLSKFKIDLETMLSSKGILREVLAESDIMTIDDSDTYPNAEEETITITCKPLRHAILRLRTYSARTSGEGELQVVVTANGKTTVLSADDVFDDGFETYGVMEDYDLTRGLRLQFRVVASGCELTVLSGDRSPTFASALPDDAIVIESTTEVPYIELNWELRSNIDSIIDRNINACTYAYQYLLAHALLSEKLASDQFNVFTNTNRLVTQDNREEYHKQYKSYLSKAVQMIANQLETSPIIDSNPAETGGWHVSSII